MKNLILAALLVTCGFVTGCDKKDEAPATPAAPTTGTAKPAVAAAVGGGDSIGVTECDDYLKKMNDCMGKMPAEAKAAQEQAFKASKDAWKQAAATQAGKDALKTSCKAAVDALAANPMCK
jgi:hypothetical protein